MAVSITIHIFAPANKQGALAQLVEHRTENPCVPGSIPGGTTKENERLGFRMDAKSFSFLSMHHYRRFIKRILGFLKITFIEIVGE